MKRRGLLLTIELGLLGLWPWWLDELWRVLLQRYSYLCVGTEAGP